MAHLHFSLLIFIEITFLHSQFKWVLLYSIMQVVKKKGFLEGMERKHVRALVAMHTIREIRYELR